MSRYGYTCAHESHGHILHDSPAKQDFMNPISYPHGRLGYVVDHLVPLTKGECACPSNMPWQTIAAAKANETWE